MSIAELGASHYQDSGPESFDRTPPQDVVAEQSVLGGMMLSKDAIADVVEVLRGHDFYRPAHETIYDAVISLYGRGEPADAVTVSDELTKRGDLGRVGGAPYLHTLISSVPTAANAGYYARIVRERAVLRRLVEAGTKIVQLGYATTGGDVDDLVNAAQAEVYAVTERGTSEDYLPIGQIIESTVDEIEAAGQHGEGMVGVPTGFADLDRLTNGLHAGQMIVLAARPAIGKSTMGLDIARSAAIRNGLTTVIFSLEMSRNEITMRMLSAEARIPLQKLRQGRLDDTDWTKMARTMGELTDAPLFIDDSPNMSLMEIRAKCRRLKQRNDLKLVVIDYLQLMSSGKRVESRQQEVSEFSRAIKLLAKELEVPVIAISQLNRGSEQRTDKKPQMSDLRESGCLTRDTRVLRADTGAETTMGELFDSGATDVPVWSLDDSLRYVRRHLTHVFSTGVKPVFTLTLASGKQVRATGNHPFLTYDGWRPLEQLGVGTRLGVPRHVPAPELESTWTDDEVVACARRLSSPLAATMTIPDDVFHLPKRQIAVLLRELWREGGELRAPSGDDPGTVAWGGAPNVAIAVSRLLLRFGISVREFPGVHAGGVALVDGDDRRRFLQEIGVDGVQVPMAQALLCRAVQDTLQTPRRLLEHPVWQRVEASLSAMPTGERGDTPPLSGVATLMDEADLDVYAVNDLVWDQVISIEPGGDEEVFDATVLGNHNFVANGIAAHNSIEQDADMVILLHREDAYEKESPRAGEADFIVAKHRNGPTDTITVAFQGHYSRFVDMAQS